MYVVCFVLSTKKNYLMAPCGRALRNGRYEDHNLEDHKLKIQNDPNTLATLHCMALLGHLVLDLGIANCWRCQTSQGQAIPRHGNAKLPWTEYLTNGARDGRKRNLYVLNFLNALLQGSAVVHVVLEMCPIACCRLQPQVETSLKAQRKLRDLSVKPTSLGVILQVDLKRDMSQGA